MPKDHVPWINLGHRCHGFIEPEVRVKFRSWLWADETSTTTRDTMEIRRRCV